MTPAFEHDIQRLQAMDEEAWGGLQEDYFRRVYFFVKRYVDDHQTANARPLVAAGAAAIIQEADLSDVSLADELKHWLTSRTDLLERAVRARQLARPQALQRITELCLLAGDPA